MSNPPPFILTAASEYLTPAQYAEFVKAMQGECTIQTRHYWIAIAGGWAFAMFESGLISDSDFIAWGKFAKQ